MCVLILVRHKVTSAEHLVKIRLSIDRWDWIANLYSSKRCQMASTSVHHFVTLSQRTFAIISAGQLQTISSRRFLSCSQFHNNKKDQRSRVVICLRGENWWIFTKHYANMSVHKTWKIKERNTNNKQIRKNIELFCNLIISVIAHLFFVYITWEIFFI